MYNNSKSCIKIKNHHTEFFTVKLGVNKGDNLSPNLFKIFMNDLPEYLKDANDPIILKDKKVHCLMYADDVILLSHSATGLQSNLDKLQKFCSDWCLKVNTIIKIRF